MDTWENEPHIDRALLAHASVATPHIAGYSAQGKANAASMAVAAVAHEFALPITDWYPTQVNRTQPRMISWDEMLHTIEDYFDIAAQTAHLKTHPEQFEQMRDTYNYRQEYF
jgi:erythronate-4-phosphate dehydrogenase